MKILVVDDEQLLVKGIKFNLENDGYEVVTAYDGEEAVKIAREQSVDLIILDLMMPRLDGLGACQKIREFSMERTCVATQVILQYGQVSFPAGLSSGFTDRNAQSAT